MKKLFAGVLLVILLCPAVWADSGTNVPARPYPLDHCILCGMLVKGRVGAYAFVYRGQQIILCDKSEKELFDRAPDKYMKKMLSLEKQKNQADQD